MSFRAVINVLKGAIYTVFISNTLPGVRWLMNSYSIKAIKSLNSNKKT